MKKKIVLLPVLLFTILTTSCNSKEEKKKKDMPEWLNHPHEVLRYAEDAWPKVKMSNHKLTCFDDDLKSVIAGVPEKVKKNIDSIHLIDALDAIFDLFRRCNKYIDETTPWVLAKEEDKKDRLETVIYNLLEGIRVGAEILSPFLPETSDKIFSQLNIDNHSEEYVSSNEYNLGTPSPLFMRIDKNER